MSFSNYSNIRQTRKQHVCKWCHQFIPVGSSCGYFSGVYGDDFYHGYVHHECETALDVVMEIEGYGYIELDDAWGRGRIDGDGKLPPQFTKFGTRTSEPLSERGEKAWNQICERKITQ